MTNNADGTVSLTDVTQYTQTGDVWGAGDANNFGAAINQNATDITTKADKTKKVSVALPASGWVGNAAPYTQTVSVEGMTANTHAGADFEHANALETEKARIKAWSYINFFTQGDGTVTAHCLERLPTTDLTLVLAILG